MKLSVAIITFNEAANLPRTLESVRSLVANGQGEIVIVDSGSTDGTLDIARQFGAAVFVEKWKGFAAQKNSAFEKCSGDWILSLDADEALSQGASDLIVRKIATADPRVDGFWLPRKNYFLGRWIRHGGFYPDPKLRLFRRGKGRVEDRIVHETIKVGGETAWLEGGVHIEHHAYPTLAGYIEHMNRYSSLGAEMAIAKGQTQRNLLRWTWNVVLRPAATFFYNYFLRLGFLDAREGLLLHMYHAAYVSWKYAKTWELARNAGEK